MGRHGTSHHEKAIYQISKHSLQQKVRNVLQKGVTDEWTDGQTRGLQNGIIITNIVAHVVMLSIPPLRKLNWTVPKLLTPYAPPTSI